MTYEDDADIATGEIQLIGPTIALVGRPNVGKSSLFNRLAGKKLAIVDDQPGVTRDYKTAPFFIHGKPATLMDTAGLSEGKETLERSMTAQSLRALEQADILLFMIDAHEGVVPGDQDFAKVLRKLGKPLILLANKADYSHSNAIHNDTGRLGFGAPILISAAHGTGVEELLVAIEKHAVWQEIPQDIVVENDDEEAEDENRPLRLAIVGRPNAGKSTLLNALVGDQRSLVSDVAGTTRDSVSVDWEYEGRPLRLVDTAGMRRRSKVVDKVEKMSTDESLRIIRLAELVIVVVDATMSFDQQDMIIIQHVFDEGRAMVLVVNKWDKVENKKAGEEHLRYVLERSLPFVRGIPIITMSALHGGRGLASLMKAVFVQYKIWNTRISTGPLNRWLEQMIIRNPAPLAKGRPNKMRYMTQTKARPPTFAIWVSQPDDLPDTYERYLISGMRQDFKMPGVPIRIIKKKTDNPFADRKSE